ncbi:nitrogenase iron-molybdenum cofactor biosynthesis protein NifE [Anaerobacillus alkalilacustris]|uniref:Nitrogenase iron-molybdenum cofactor biosynthesis protein NifE n=1 Tax=Anaerobacillus alkalilacustris TaxID=393763 RepID=A0A1S2LXR4_9BACI|nr:nitrogenase iron-molybdenum cofactor biosynthesis protein NifE [Anaerobacillus alkalilacustris]OIJ17299.1 nitrogenase iron-molybdenum cofactor biosynthesis protein NifE [Anaerobacillus alkalilacustris]
MNHNVKEAFQEPACEHNHTPKAKQGCARPKPGEAAGGCSFDGSQITLLPITDAAHIVHGPIACAGNSWGGRGSLSSGPLLYQYGLTTDLSEQDIIMGGEKKLKSAISEVIARFQPPAIFVYATCVTSLIGDDLDFVCKNESKKWNIPIIPVNSPGFVGSKNLGNRLAGYSLLQHVIGTGEPKKVTDYDVNVIGEYNIAGEYWDVKELFDQVGIRVLSKITGDGRYREITYAHRAKVNMVVCSRALISLAREMDEKYKIPYFEGSFYGIKETSFSLRQIAYLIGDRTLEAKVDELIYEEEEKVFSELLTHRQFLKGKKAVLYTGGVKSWSIISALKELGIEVVGVGTNKSTLEDISKIKERVGFDCVLIEKGGAKEILNVIRNKQADILIAGGRNMYLAIKEQIPFLDINQERHTAYATYKGIRRLANDLVHSIQHPIWKITKYKAPWVGDNDGY